MAADNMRVANARRDWGARLAMGGRERTTRMKTTTARYVNRIWRFAFENDAPGTSRGVLDARGRHRRNQSLGVGVCWMGQHLFGGALFDDAS